MQRVGGRLPEEVRQLSVVYDVCRHAAGSTLFSMGATAVVSAVTLQTGVPPFLRGKRTGWLTAEYAMLPAATHVRSARESVAVKRAGRSVEISRLIGRVFRAVVDLSVLGERTISIDCDVLNADGGTRSAAINGALLALRMAQERWLREGVIKQPLLREEFAAVSVGITAHTIMVDLNYDEDTAVIADVNFVLTRSGKLIEIQGASEDKPVLWSDIVLAQSLAQKSVFHIIAWCDTQTAFAQSIAIAGASQIAV